MESPEAWCIHCSEKSGANRISQSKLNRGTQGEKDAGQTPRTASLLTLCERPIACSDNIGRRYARIAVDFELYLLGIMREAVRILP